MWLSIQYINNKYQASLFRLTFYAEIVKTKCSKVTFRGKKSNNYFDERKIFI